jgi:hypothetical protein
MRGDVTKNGIRNLNIDNWIYGAKHAKLRTFVEKSKIFRK